MIHLPHNAALLIIDVQKIVTTAELLHMSL